MSFGIFSSHVGETPVQAHNGASSLLAWHVVNRSASQAYLLSFDDVPGNITIGTTNPLYIVAIPAGGRSELTLPAGIAHSTAISVACLNARGGGAGSGVDSDVLLQFSY